MFEQNRIQIANRLQSSMHMFIGYRFWFDSMSSEWVLFIRLFFTALLCSLGSPQYFENFGWVWCRHSSHKLSWGTGNGGCISLFQNGLCRLSFLGWWGEIKFQISRKFVQRFRFHSRSNFYCILLRGQTEHAVIYYNCSWNPGRSRENSRKTEQGGEGNSTTDGNSVFSLLSWLLLQLT